MKTIDLNYVPVIMRQKVKTVINWLLGGQITYWYIIAFNNLTYWLGLGLRHFLFWLYVFIWCLIVFLSAQSKKNTIITPKNHSDMFIKTRVVLHFVLRTIFWYNFLVIFSGQFLRTMFWTFLWTFIGLYFETFFNAFNFLSAQISKEDQN